MSGSVSEDKSIKKKDFGFKDVIAYGAGDFGCNMSFALKSYLTIYWTQYMGLDSVAVAGLLLLVQVWDAINDPLIGILVDADTRQYKRNKFLTYIWVGSIGLVVAGALCFVPWPTAPQIIKTILFVGGYIIWDAFYTVANVPYGSLLSLITDDPEQRTRLSTGRSVGSMAGGILCSICVPMIIYDASNNLRGEYMIVIGLVLGMIGFCCFQFMIRNTKVRVDASNRAGATKPGEKVSFNPFRGIGHFLRNRAAIGATLAPVGTFIGMYGAQTSSQIMFQSYFGASQISGIISMVSYLGLFLFMIPAPYITKRIGKKEGCLIGAGISALAYVLMLVLPIEANSTGLAMYVGCQVLSALGLGYGNCVSWSLMADAMDYEEWKFGTRNEGTTYAMHSFFRKLAQGVGPSIGLLVATYLGYDAALGAAQTATVAHNMLMQTAAFYLLSAVISIIAYGLVYNLDKKTLGQMQEDLGKRHEEEKIRLADIMSANDD